MVHAVDIISDAGMSQPERPITSDADMADWLNDVLDELDLDAVHLVGLSFGACVAVNQALKSPDRVASLTAVEPTGIITMPRSSFMIGTVRAFAAYKITRSTKPLLRLAESLSGGPEIIDGPWADLVLSSLADVKANQLMPAKLSDTELASIDTPTLMLLAGDSPIFHIDKTIERATSLMPNLRIEVVPDSGHAIPLEQPDLFNN